MLIIDTIIVDTINFLQSKYSEILFLLHRACLITCLIAAWDMSYIHGNAAFRSTYLWCYFYIKDIAQNRLPVKYMTRNMFL